MRRAKFLVVAIVAAVVLAACGSSDSSSNDPNTDARLTVYTPPQLEDVVNEIATAFEANNPGEPITIITEEQDAIVKSVADGAADIAVLPDVWLASSGADLDTGSFGRNLAVIAVPAGNPAGVTDTQVFAADSGQRTAVCGEDTPVGNFSLIVLANAGVTPDPATVAEGCEAEALAQIADGELDAALMFRNGLQVPDGVMLLDIDESQNVIFELTYVVVGTSAETTAFGVFLGSDEVNDILIANGYLP